MGGAGLPLEGWPAEALLVAAVQGLLEAMPLDDMTHLAHRLGLRLAPKDRGQRYRVATRILRRAVDATGARQVRDALVQLLGGTEPMTAARTAATLRAAPGLAPTLFWLLRELGHLEVAEAAWGQLEPAEQAACREALAEAIRWAEAFAADERRRREVAARGRAEAELHTARARRVAATALEHAARETERARRAARQAADRVAAAEARARQAEAEAAHLRELLAERDEQVGRLVAAFERRLALERAAWEQGAPVPPPSLPLAGRRVLVLGDPGRAVAYRAEALAMGAESVAVLDGTGTRGAELSQLCRGADVVVLIAGYAKHTVDAKVRKSLPRHALFVRVPTAGVASFRKHVAAAVADG
jgi:hypothetical protein